MALNKKYNIDVIHKALSEVSSDKKELAFLAGMAGIKYKNINEALKTEEKELSILKRLLTVRSKKEDIEKRLYGSSNAESESFLRRRSTQKRSLQKKLLELGLYFDFNNKEKYKLENRREYFSLRNKEEFPDLFDYERDYLTKGQLEAESKKEEEQRKQGHKLAIDRSNRKYKDTLQSLANDRYNVALSGSNARSRYSDFMRSHIDPRRYRLAQLAHSFYEEPIPSTLQDRADFKAGKWDYDEKRKEARKIAMDKAKKALAAETQNTKSVNENTKALFGLRAFLGPYAKAVMPFYGAKMFYDLTKSDTSASLARVNRRTFGGLYGASGNPRRGYRRMFDAMTSYGASEQDVMREYVGQKKWASTLMFGMGLDKIEALAMVLGKAPGPAEMRDPELMQRWLRENMRGITDMQAMQLSAMGVASDAFIESTRKGQAVDTEGETARIHRRYETLYEQQGGWENPFRKLQFGIGRDNANALAEGGLTGFIYEFEMDVLRKLGNVWGALFSKNETGTTSPRDEYGIIPRQTSVTVNINGNIDSEERAHSFVEQIGAVVSNAEK